MKMLQPGRTDSEKNVRKMECQDDNHDDDFDDKDFVKQTIIRQAPQFYDDQRQNKAQ